MLRIGNLRSQQVLWNLYWKSASWAPQN